VVIHKCIIPKDVTVGLQAESFTVNEKDGVVRVCAEVIHGQNERDVLVSLSTSETGFARG